MKIKTTGAGAFVLLVVCGLASPAAEGLQRAERYAGRLVAEVLGELQQRGAPIIFSSTLVGPDLRVKGKPRRRQGLRELAEDILAPHGLALTKGPGNSWLVVRASKTEAPASSGQVKPPPAEPASPPRQTPIRIEEQVDVRDRAGDLARSPSVYTVAVEKITETAGSLENPFQLLTSMPGIVATNDHDGRFAVRGGGPENNSILFEGVQIHRPQRTASDLGGQQSFVHPATIESLSVDASALDARYGGRLSSATLFETRSGTTNRRLTVSGSAGLTSGDVLLEGRLPRTMTGSWWTSVRGTYYRLVAERFKDGDIPSFMDVQFKVAVKPTANTSLSLFGLSGGESMERPLLGPPEHHPNMEGENHREFHADTRLAIAKLRWTPGPRVATTTTIDAYSNASRARDAWIDWLTGVPFDRRVDATDVGARQQVSVAWSPRYLLDAGGEVHRIRSSWKMQGIDLFPSRAVGPTISGRFVEYEGLIDAHLVRTTASAWAQQSVPLPGGVVAEPGVRVDWNSWTGETAVQPRLRLTRSFGPSTVVWTGVAWQAQTPGYETIQHGVPYYELLGPEGSDVRNERMRQVVVGLERRLGSGTTLRLEAYHRSFDRLLVQRTETDLERGRRLARYEIPADMPLDSALLEYRPTSDPQSVGKGRSSGLEVLLDRSRGRITGWVSYTLSKAERELFGRTVPFDYDRTHALSLAVNVLLTSKLRWSTRSQLASGFPVTPFHDEVFFNDYRNVFPGPPPGSRFRTGRNADGSLQTHPDVNGMPRISLLNSARLSPYGRTDIRFTYAFDKRLEAYSEIINLFNRQNHHTFLMDATIPGRSPIQWNVASAFPRLFTYGVRFKF